MAGTDPTTVAVTTTLRAKAGREEELAGVLRRFAARVRREEAGCLAFQPARSQHESSRFVVIERYRDAEALAAHANAEHFREVLPSLMDCLETPPEVALFDELAEGTT